MPAVRTGDRDRLRGLALAAGAAILLAAVGVAGGGYLPRAWRLTGFALAALARLDWCFLGGLTAVTGWTTLSVVWTGHQTTAVLEGERAALYLVCAAAVLLVAERESLPYLLAGVVVGVTTVAAFGLGKYLFTPRVLNPLEGKLLFEPIGYANGFGIFVAIAVVVTVGLALAVAGRALRLAALAPLVVLLPTLYL
ncbi:MAG: hypothetical protein QOE36_814, partial [Gaiellaceae bacterium]|nr:hypothetical protein [Gaiellaceae bacterium]